MFVKEGTDGRAEHSRYLLDRCDRGVSNVLLDLTDKARGVSCPLCQLGHSQPTLGPEGTDPSAESHRRSPLEVILTKLSVVLTTVRGWCQEQRPRLPRPDHCCRCDAPPRAASPEAGGLSRVPALACPLRSWPSEGPGHGSRAHR